MSGWLTNGVPQLTTLDPLFQLPADTENASGEYPQSGYVALGQVAGFAYVPWVHGRFYGLPAGGTPVAVLTVASTLYAYPVYIPSIVTVASLNLSVTTGQTAGASHLGIYADNGAGYPGALVYDSGALVSASTALVTDTGIAGTVLQPGLYWMASIYSASGTYISVAGVSAVYTQALNAALGSDTAAHALAASAQAATGISVAGTYGALPSTFTSGATLTLNAATPLISLGV